MHLLTERLFAHVTTIPLLHLRTFAVVIPQYRLMTSWDPDFPNFLKNLFIAVFSPKSESTRYIYITLHLLVVFFLSFVWEQSLQFFSLYNINFLKIAGQEYSWFVLKTILDLCNLFFSLQATLVLLFQHFLKIGIFHLKASLDPGRHFG